MRSQPNRQTVSTTARWNMAQSDPASPGAQKKPLKNQQTGQGTNVLQLKRALAVAELHLSQTSDPALVTNLTHGITLLRAQIARASGVDYTDVDVTSVPEQSTGYHFAGFVDPPAFGGDAIDKAGVDQTPISPYAQFQLFGTLRQKITKVDPHKTVTPAGHPVWPGEPQNRSNVIRNVDNPKGSVFPTGVPGSLEGYHPQADTRDNDFASGRWYRQDDPATHINVHIGNGVVPSAQGVARGKHGQYVGGYSFQFDTGGI